MVRTNGYTTAVVKTDGSLWMWGDNGIGELGDGTTTSRSTPVQVMDDVKSVSVYGSVYGPGVSVYGSTAAIKEDGSLWMWGYNGNGQLGDGTTTDRYSPIPIMDLTAGTATATPTSGAEKNISDATLTLSCYNYSYDGTAKTPTVTVKYNLTTLTEGTDYTIAYADNIEVGTATVTVTGMGDYTGVQTISFEIKEAGTGGIVSKFTLDESASGDLSGDKIWIEGTLSLDGDTTLTKDEWNEIISQISWVSSDTSVADEDDIQCSLGLGSLAVIEANAVSISVAVTPQGEGFTTITGTIGELSASSMVSVVDDPGKDAVERHITGTLIDVNISLFTVTIGNTEYGVTSDFDMSAAQSILEDSSCKTVAAVLLDNKVSRMDVVTDLVKMNVAVTANPGSLTYQDGKFDNEELAVTATFTCMVDPDSPYTVNDLKGTEAEDVSFAFTGYKLSTYGGGLCFKTGPFSTSSEYTDNEAFTLKLGEEKTVSQTAYKKSGYTPSVLNDTLSIVAEGIGAAATSWIYDVTVNNLDILGSASSDKETKKQAKDAQEKLDKLGNTALALDESALQEYFSNSEIEKIESCVNAWLAQIFVVNALAEEKTVVEKLQNQFGLTTDKFTKKIFKKAWKVLGVDVPEATATVNIDDVSGAYTTVLASASKGGESGNALKVVFSLTDMKFYKLDSGSAFAGQGYLSYYVEDSQGNKHKPISSSMMEGFGGMVEYDNISALAESMKKVAMNSFNSVFKEVWGGDADKLISEIKSQIDENETNVFVEALTSDALEKVLKEGKLIFSNGVFKTSQKISESVTKKTSIHCPVDVYVYDSEGVLCGSIVSDKIVVDTNVVGMNVEGDKKCVYTSDDDYTLKLVGSGSGTMDIEITSLVDGEEVRTTAYGDIPLEEGTTYYSNIPESVYVDNIVMNPLAASGGAILPVSDTWQDGQAPRVYAEGVTLNQDALTLEAGDTATLSATVAPADASDPYVRWESSDKTVATVSDGVVTAVSAGTAQIKAVTLDGGYEAVCTVTVKAASKPTATPTKEVTPTPKPTSSPAKKEQILRVSPSSVKVACKAWKWLNITGAHGTVACSSSNKKVARVSVIGKVMGIKPGVATITVRAASTSTYKAATIKVRVEVVRAAQTVKARKLKATYKAKALKRKAKSFSIRATCKGKGISKKITYTKMSGSSNLKISRKGKVTVKKGTKKGIYTAKVKIMVPKSATYYEGATVTKSVKVTVK